MEEPLRDFSRQETLIEIDRLRQRKTSKGDVAFRQASDDLVSLAKALDRWYSAGSANATLIAAASPLDAVEPL